MYTISAPVTCHCKMRYQLSILLTVVLVLTICTLGYAFRPKNTVEPTPVQTEQDDPKKKAIEHIFRETEDFTYRYKVDSFTHRPTSSGAVVMLGDSLTDLGAWNEFFPSTRIINRGISGDNTFGILHRLDQISALKPRAIFLLVGTNDLFWGASVEDTVDRYRQILTTLISANPKARIYVQSVFPYHRLPKGDYGYLDNVNAEALNRRIELLATEHRVTFLNVWPHLIDENGRLNEKYTTDGIHLNGLGYQTWVGVLAPHVKASY